jgi:hypothetical protein
MSPIPREDIYARNYHFDIVPETSQIESHLYAGSTHPGSTEPLDYGEAGTQISLESCLPPAGGVDNTNALYLRNIPPNLMIRQLQDLLDDRGLFGSYCAIVLPPDLGRPQTLNRQGELKFDLSGDLCFSNYGYAFIIFRTKRDGQECKLKLDEWNQWGKYGSGSKKSLAIAEAHVQGLDNLIEKHQNSEVWHQSVPLNCRYLLFDEHGCEKPWPLPSKRIQAPLSLINAQHIIMQNGGKFLPLPDKGNFRYPKGEEHARLADKGKGKVGEKGRGYKDKGNNSNGFKGPLVPMSMLAGMPMYSTPSPLAPVAPKVCQPYDQTYMEMQRGMYGEQLYPMLHPLCPSPYLAQSTTDMTLQLPQNELLPNLENLEKLQRQMYGQKLYPMVQRLSPNLARKITGMLIELPEDDLMLILTNPEELQRQFQKAIGLLEEAERKGVRGEPLKCNA